MDRRRIGRSLRALRLRRALRRADAAAVVGISRSLVSKIERGDLAGVALVRLASLAEAFDAELDVRIRWRGEGLDRLLDETHAGVVNAFVELIRGFGWETAIEVSFSIYGERGAIDVLAWHAATGTLLVAEIKSVIPDAQAMISALDRKSRLGPRIAADRGWKAASASRLLVVLDGSTSRRRVADLGAIFGAAFPQRGRAVRQWLREPGVGPISNVLFLPDSRHTTGRLRSGRPWCGSALRTGQGSARCAVPENLGQFSGRFVAAAHSRTFGAPPSVVLAEQARPWQESGNGAS